MRMTLTNRRPRQTASSKAGLIFPPSRSIRRLRSFSCVSRISPTAGVFCAAVLEYLAAELLEVSGNTCRDLRMKRIIPRHIQLAVRNDSELDELLKKTTIAQAGVLPHIHVALLPKSKIKKKQKQDAEAFTGACVCGIVW